MDDLLPLVRILHSVRHESRRAAKRLIREAGGKGSAGELNTLLAEIADHPRRAEIERLSEQLHADQQAAARNLTSYAARISTPGRRCT